ncbi:MAG: hypothetical protein OHK0024_03110 [Thalassobaculales bacterium]
MTGNLRLAVLGGDGREARIAARAAAEGYDVVSFAVPGGPRPAASLEQALRGAAVAVLPVPAMTGDRLFAPDWPEPLHLSDQALAGMAAGGLLVSGSAEAGLRRRALALDIRVATYGDDPGLAALRGPLIAAAAVAELARRGRMPGRGEVAGVVGLGRIGAPLARLLAGGGARVIGFARKPMAAFQPAEVAIAPLRDLDALAGGFGFLAATCGGWAVGPSVLRALRPAATVLDLASPPGSFDAGGDADLARRIIWLRGLGGALPEALGDAQWQAIRARLA